MNSFFHIGSFTRYAAKATFSRLGTCWRSRARITGLVLIAVLFANSMGQDAAAQVRPTPDSDKLGIKSETTLAVGALGGVVAGVGVGVYLIIQHAHTVTGCVSDDPNGLQLHLPNGQTFVLLGATTNIKADTRIKVRGTRRKRIKGITDQPSFVVEKVGKVYGACSVIPVNP